MSCWSCWACQTGDPPVLGVGDHVAHVEVVRQDARLALQREAQVQQVGRGGVDAAHQHALVADVADADLERGLGGPGDQRGDRLGVVDVGVDGQVDAAAGGGAGDPLQALDDVGLQPVLGQAHQRLGGQPDVADGLDAPAAASGTTRGCFHGTLATSPPETTTSRTPGWAFR